MIAGVVIGFACGFGGALALVSAATRQARHRLQRILDPTRGYLDEE